ncbi:MAG TPA: deoxyribodipyrimidine photo-lyase [Bacteroidia bacterium]|nr:deoxyribodipyrimidine photo-lyase [Bacteroidia bacterium]HNT79247.1 deoxyribodipyrimidine photo-lyase [Bacteroidia bacterium]
MSKSKDRINIMWFRRDLRLEDNTALNHALQSNLPILCIFIFDTNILNRLPSKTDRRIQFIHYHIQLIHEKLLQHNSGLKVLFGNPIDELKLILSEFQVENIYCNHDYEPYATLRDQNIRELCNQYSCVFHSFKDQVVFERTEICKSDGTPYHVFTPFKNKWISTYEQQIEGENTSIIPLNNFYKIPQSQILRLTDLGFNPISFEMNIPELNLTSLKKYNQLRNLPSEDAGSKLSIHLRFGTISIRKIVQQAKQINQQWLFEFIWREFFMMLLWNYPTLIDEPKNKKFENINWINDEKQFELWCEGNTGYPIVDAGMRELNKTGYMHNRVRMIGASFLCKHLLIDWKWGEAYFANHLNDFELSSNNGNWQWVVGCGFDAAPYFRIFNPISQAKKFDPQQLYICKWIEDFNTDKYPYPIVDHALARKRCLEVYAKALKSVN